MRQVEESAKNVDLAIEKALTKLGITQNQAEIEVLSAGGLFKQAKVRVTKKQTDGDVAAKFVEEVLEKMGLTFVVELEESETDVKLELTGTETGCVIGYRGEVLDALQYLASLVANKGKEGYKRIILDTENYRARREETLKKLANSMANKAVKYKKDMSLEPMNPYERRIIHSALQNHKYVKTKSVGEEPNRRIVVTLNK